MLALYLESTCSVQPALCASILASVISYFMFSKLLIFCFAALVSCGCAFQHQPRMQLAQTTSPKQYKELAVSYSNLEPRHLMGFDEFQSHIDREEVRLYLAYYQQGSGLQFLRDGVNRMGDHQDQVTDVLTSYNLPRELLSVPLVESRFKRRARSSRGAVGVWQLTRGAARKGGIRPSERVNVLESTKAASKYIIDLYDLFEDWPLALAAYNGGRTRVQRAIKKSGSRDFFYLAENKLLPLETRRYVPKVLAVSYLLCRERVICE